MQVRPPKLVCRQEPVGQGPVSCTVAITFFNPSSFQLTRRFNTGPVESSLFFKLPLEDEDSTEETCGAGWVGGDSQEQLKRKIEDETTALVKELNAEWLGWSELPFSSPLVQFKPGFYRLESSECNWPAVGALDPAEINYDDDGDILDFKFLVCPKVKKPVILFTCVKSTISGGLPDSGPWTCDDERAPAHSLGYLLWGRGPSEALTEFSSEIYLWRPP